MFESYLLAGLRQAPVGSGGPGAPRLQLRLPWYRSLTLASIERLDIGIDGVEQPPESLTIVLNGARHPLTDVAGLGQVWWFVLDTLDVELGASVGLASGTHRLSAILALQIPYGDPDFRTQLDIKQVAAGTREFTLPGRNE